MELLNVSAKVDATNVTLTTTSETVIISSDPLPMEYNNATFLIRAWAQLTTGTNCTTVKPRIRRGTTTSGTLVNEANAQTIAAAAGSTEYYATAAVDVRSGESACQFSLTLEQAGASGDGTVLQSGIEVYQMN